MLYGQTASEANNDGFYLPKINDGKEWNDLTFIKGQGTSILLQGYQYTDTQPSVGINYYRLKQVDYDGNYEYSNVVSAAFQSEKNEFEIYSNPADDFIFIKSNNIFTKIEIIDIHGRIEKDVGLELE